MILLVAVPLLLLLTPVWVHLAIDISGGTVPGGSPADAHRISDATVRDLLLGGSFAMTAPDGSAMYTADEAAHMADVRVVLYGFLALAVLSAAVLVGALRHGRADASRWSAVARGAVFLVVVLIVLGVIGALAFGVAFELFHQILFPGGNWAFPADSNLIRLYPYAFWQASAAALGVLAIVLAAITWFFARGRAAALEEAGR